MVVDQNVSHQSNSNKTGLNNQSMLTQNVNYKLENNLNPENMHFSTNRNEKENPNK